MGTAGSDGLASSGVISPLSVSIRSNHPASPTIINLADDLISILALGENVRLMDAGRCFCQFVGFK